MAHLLGREGLLLQRGVQLVEPAQPAALAVAPAAQALHARRPHAWRGWRKLGGRQVLREASAGVEAEQGRRRAHAGRQLAEGRTFAIRLQFWGPYVCREQGRKQAAGWCTRPASMWREMAARLRRGASALAPAMGHTGEQQRTCTSCTNLTSSCIIRRPGAQTGSRGSNQPSATGRDWCSGGWANRRAAACHPPTPGHATGRPC